MEEFNGTFYIEFVGDHKPRRIRCHGVFLTNGMPLLLKDENRPNTIYLMGSIISMTRVRSSNDGL